MALNSLYYTKCHRLLIQSLMLYTGHGYYSACRQVNYPQATKVNSAFHPSGVGKLQFT